MNVVQYMILFNIMNSIQHGDQTTSVCWRRWRETGFYSRFFSLFSTLSSLFTSGLLCPAGAEDLPDWSQEAHHRLLGREALWGASSQAPPPVSDQGEILQTPAVAPAATSVLLWRSCLNAAGWRCQFVCYRLMLQVWMLQVNAAGKCCRFECCRLMLQVWMLQV